MNHRFGFRPHQGVALPIVLIMLVVLAFAGLLAARRSGGLQEVSTNARIRQAAEFSAQSALRECEAIVIDVVDNDGAVHGEQQKHFGTAVLTGPDDPTALWRDQDNWADGSTYRIRLTPSNTDVSNDTARLPHAHCLIQPMQGDRYLITAQGMSAGANFDANGQLVGGSEIWLQSVISPTVPVQSTEGGMQ